MSDFSLTLVLQIKTSKIVNDMAKVSIKSEKITAFGGIFFVLDKFDRILSVAVVAVLQFQNRCYDSQKLTLYLYINIEVFLGYGNSLERTATLQQVQHMETKLWEIGGNKQALKIDHNFPELNF